MLCESVLLEAAPRTAKRTRRLVVAIGRHQEDGMLVDATREELQRRHRRGARPMQILEHDHERPRAGETGQAGRECFEEPAVFALRIDGAQRRKVGAAAAEFGDELT